MMRKNKRRNYLRLNQTKDNQKPKKIMKRRRRKIKVEHYLNLLFGRRIVLKQLNSLTINKTNNLKKCLITEQTVVSIDTDVTHQIGL